MDAQIIKTFGQVAGIGGLALGVFLYLFKEIIRQNFFSRLTKKHSYDIIRLMLILIWSIALAGIGTWVYVGQASVAPNFARYDLNKSIPFDTGWIFVGYYDFEHNAYIEGPYAQIAYRPVNVEQHSKIARIGDILSIRKLRNVVIANYKTQGLQHQLKSPPLVNEVLSENDYTGIKLSKGMFVMVRDVEISASRGKRASIWCRIVECDADNESCKKAIDNH